MADRGQRHDTGAVCRLQRGGELHRQRHVAEMVGAELAFPALADAGEGRGHDAGIVDQDVQAAAGFEIMVGEAAHAGEVAEVHGGDLDFAGDAGQRFGGGVCPARRNRDARAGAGEGANGFEADAGIAAGDDDVLS